LIKLTQEREITPFGFIATISGADYKETQLAYMRPGQTVDLRIDAYPGRSDFEKKTYKKIEIAQQCEVCRLFESGQ
jgi:hypothetical protein